MKMLSSKMISKYKGDAINNGKMIVNIFTKFVVNVLESVANEIPSSISRCLSECIRIVIS